MRVPRVLLMLAVFGCLAVPAAHAGAPPSLRMLACSDPSGAVGGVVRYEARMKSIPGSERMTIRFDLYERDGDVFRRVSIGEVNKSRRGVSDFRWEHKFEGLREGSTYRVKVVYRWLDAEGEELSVARRRGEPCKQPAGDPNLRVAAVSVEGGDLAGAAVYRVTVVNRGDAEARGVAVLLRVDGEVVDESDLIEGLAPGESKTVEFVGPSCRDSLRAVVDPKDVIDESHEDDNIRTASCV